MMSPIKRFAGIVSLISSRIGMLAITILLFLTVGDVLGRYAFNAPIPGTYELTKILFALSVFFSLPVSQFNGENLGITLLYDRFPLKVKGILDLMSALISITVFIVGFSQTLKYAARMKNAHTVTSVLRLPMHPWIYIASIGILCLIAVLLWDLAVSIKELLGRDGNES